MNLSDIPYNLNYKFDDDMREVPVNKIEMDKGVKFLIEKSQSLSKNDNELAKVYGLIGVFSRMIGKLEDSKKYLELAIKINKQRKNDIGVYVNELRLAHTYQWEKAFEKANNLFHKLIEQAETNEEFNNYLDFVYQHHGKNLFDQQKYEEAMRYFEKALSIRLNKENKDLIDSTKHAITICKDKMLSQNV